MMSLKQLGVFVFCIVAAHVGLSTAYVSRVAMRLNNRMGGHGVSLSRSHQSYQGVLVDTARRSSNEEQFTIKDVFALGPNGVVQSRWWGVYNRAISSKGVQAVLTKSCSSFFGFLIGDLLSQILTSSAKFNMVRFLRMGTFGAFVHAPAGHFFYRNLEESIPGSSRNAVVKKVIVDQLLWTPLFAALMFSYNGVLAGNALTTVLEAMKTSKSVVTYMITSLLLWPTAHYINYNAVPPNKRLLFINTVQIFFNTIIAGLAATFSASFA